MIAPGLLGNIIQCTSESNCYLCRHKRLGRAWRQAVAEKLGLPRNETDFLCPVGRSWGYVPRDVPMSMEEQKRYVCYLCQAESCNQVADEEAGCPEEKWPDTIDVVYPYFATEAESDELRYSLRSLRNIQEKVNVWIVGDRPKWLDTSIVHYIPHFRISKNRDIDSAAKFKLAAEHEDMGKQFVYMNDDIYFIAPVTTPFLAVPRYIADYTGDIDRFNAESPWEKTSVRGFRALEERNYPARDYSLHWPYVFNTEEFLGLYPEFNVDNTPHNLENIYYNIYARCPVPFDGGIVRVQSTISVPALYRLVKNTLVLNNKKDAFQSVAGLLAALFPDPSPYERIQKKQKEQEKIPVMIETGIVEEELGMSLVKFMSSLRSSLTGIETAQNLFKDTSRIFAPLEHYTLMNVYQEGKTMIRWGCKRATMDKAITNNIKRISGNSRFEVELVRDSGKSGVKFETIREEVPIQISKQNIDEQFTNAGLKIVTQDNEIYLLPSDAKANNLLTLREKILSLLTRPGYLNDHITLKDLLEETDKNIECFLVNSFWVLEMDNRLYREDAEGDIPRICTEWLPYHPVRST